MASSLISNNDLSDFKSALLDHFESFKRTITVHKEPKKTILNKVQTAYPGYGPQHSQSENITFTPVSQTFDAVIWYKQPVSQELELLATNTSIPQNQCRIKVAEAARNYIETGKTEAIDVDSKRYNSIAADGRQVYCGQTYYYYLLEETK